MLLKYTWIIPLSSALYMLYYSNYFTYITKYVKDYYSEFILQLNEASSGEIVKENGEILFTSSALKKYTNLENGLYLAILGEVFDVSSGKTHYGPGQSYNAFTGRDGSAAFITGDFTESGLTDDISSLTYKQIQSLLTWVEFYRKTYIYKGKLIGRYYDKNGEPTNERYILDEKIQIAKKNDLNEEKEKLKFPPCNVEWNAETGTTVWCSESSGGVSRNWKGVPQKYYSNPESEDFRCACINLHGKDYQDNKGMIKPYDNCTDDKTTCFIKVAE